MGGGDAVVVGSGKGGVETFAPVTMPAAASAAAVPAVVPAAIPVSPHAATAASLLPLPVLLICLQH